MDRLPSFQRRWISVNFSCWERSTEDRWALPGTENEEEQCWFVETVRTGDVERYSTD